MSYILNDKIRNLTPYHPITGEYRVRMDANESYIEIEPKQFGMAMVGGLNRYPDPYATEVCRAFGELNGVSSELVTAGNGSDELISLIVGAFFQHGDKIVTLQHDFSMYRFYGEVFGIKVDTCPKLDDLQIDVDMVIEHLKSSGARGLIFSNPCNPTSLCLSRAEVLRIVESTDALVVVDEAYMDFSDQSILDICGEYDNLIVLKTCSKAVGLAGIRLGFAVANSVLTNALRAVKSPYNVNHITQIIGQLVLTDKKYIYDCTEKLIASRDYLYREIQSIQAKFCLFDCIYKPETNFVFIKTGHAETIFKAMLGRSIAVRCMGGYLRISAASPEENGIFLKELEDICKELTNT